MKNAMIFPGQGSQKVGMGKDLADSFPVAKNVFEAVDDALNIKLSSIIWEGRLEELTLTENAQPALMANSMAILSVLESEGLKMQFMDFVAGHSLGEYTALCAAKSISIEDTAVLLRRRGVAMQACVQTGEGSMAVILGLNAAQIQEILDNFSGEGICQIANDNDPNQVVISGNRSDVDKVIELTKKKGAKRSLPLNVSAPFHCEIMAPAANEMKEALKDIHINVPKIPIVMNTIAEAITDPEKIRTLLVDQIVGMVRWRETVSYIYGKGPARFYEVGSGKVLSGMVKRTEIDAQTLCISSYQDILEAMRGLKNGSTK